MEKDPNAPKKPLNAFLLFAQHYRQSIKESNPDLAYGDLNKVAGTRAPNAQKLGEMWASSLSPGEKQRFIDEAGKMSSTYHRQLSEYNQTKSEPKALDPKTPEKAVEPKKKKSKSAERKETVAFDKGPGCAVEPLPATAVESPTSSQQFDKGPQLVSEKPKKRKKKSKLPDAQT